MAGIISDFENLETETCLLNFEMMLSNLMEGCSSTLLLMKKTKFYMLVFLAGRDIG